HPARKSMSPGRAPGPNSGGEPGVDPYRRSQVHARRPAAPRASPCRLVGLRGRTPGASRAWIPHRRSQIRARPAAPCVRVHVGRPGAGAELRGRGRRGPGAGPWGWAGREALTAAVGSRTMSAPPSRNERIKEASRFLRGGIAEGLEQVETGAIAEEDAQLTKFHGTYLQDDRDLRPERRKKMLEPAYMFMVRLRLPGGVCTPAQWLALDRIATDYANGTLRLTTRQTF